MSFFGNLYHIEKHGSWTGAECLRNSFRSQQFGCWWTSDVSCLGRFPTGSRTWEAWTRSRRKCRNSDKFVRTHLACRVSSQVMRWQSDILKNPVRYRLLLKQLWKMFANISNLWYCGWSNSSAKRIGTQKVHFSGLQEGKIFFFSLVKSGKRRNCSDMICSRIVLSRPSRSSCSSQVICTYNMGPICNIDIHLG